MPTIAEVGKKSGREEGRREGEKKERRRGKRGAVSALCGEHAGPHTTDES